MKRKNHGQGKRVYEIPKRVYKIPEIPEKKRNKVNKPVYVIPEVKSLAHTSAR